MRLRSGVRISSWLPRGAMDLNAVTAASLAVSARWLPRGAMDLNPDRLMIRPVMLVGSLVEPWI